MPMKMFAAFTAKSVPTDGAAMELAMSGQVLLLVEGD
jgi:hypothetical protein